MKIVDVDSSSSGEGTTPCEWLDVGTDGADIQPPTPEEWRDALLRTLSES